MAGRIEICGGIATGKTTLARLLATAIDCELVLEDFRKNPFWERFYLRPDLFATEKNVCFIAQHTGEIKAAAHPRLTICDYAVAQDLAYASLTRDASHRLVMDGLYDHMYGALPPPTLVVQLRCAADVQLQRIRDRGRREEDPITVTYLQSLNEALDSVLASRPPSCALRVVRSDEINFTQTGDAVLTLKRALLEIAEK